jgi:hypothetical protein
MKRKALPLIAVITMLIGITAGANAQNRRKVTVEASVPFEFIVANRVFPAGTYVFEMATGSPKTTDQAGVLVVRNRERKLYAAVATDIASDGNAHVAPKVTFTRNGDVAYLSKVWRQGNLAGLSLRTPSLAEVGEESEVVTLDASVVNGGM